MLLLLSSLLAQAATPMATKKIANRMPACLTPAGVADVPNPDSKRKSVFRCVVGRNYVARPIDPGPDSIKDDG
jgi:hypothetical protein